MQLIRLIFIVCSLPAAIFSWSLFSTPKPEEKVDFACPHHCGQWGSESIQALEWQFVLCLYEAYKLQKFIGHNDFTYSSSFTHYSITEPKLRPYPDNFHSEWYQRMLTPNKSSREGEELLIKHHYRCQGGEGIFWNIEHLSQPDGQHLGKIFQREKYSSCWYYGYDPDDYDDDDDDDDNSYEAVAKQHENDPYWERCLYEDLVEKNKYSFKNRIDFHNACLQLEHDLAEELEDDDFRSVDDVPEFKQAMYDRFGVLSHKLQDIRNNYYDIFEKCSRLHRAPSAEYELIQRLFEDEEYADGIEALKVLLSKVKPDSLENHLASTIYTSKGWAENETLRCDQAINSLSHAINLNPTNSDAYFERAIAYFETGQFDLSLQDYLNSGFRSQQVSENSTNMCSYSIGLTKGIIAGGGHEALDFFPSLLSSLGGISHGLWAFTQHPIDVSKDFAQAARECVIFIKDHTSKEILVKLVPELQELIEKWNVLGDEEKGKITGHVIGKYGVSIFAGAGTAKGIKLYRDLKKINTLLTFEAMTLSESSASLIKLESAGRAQARKALFKHTNMKIQLDKQGKHIQGHKNFVFVKNRSILEHPNPQKLISDFAGKGMKVCNKKPGTAGYQEIVDFGEFIGYAVSEDTGGKIATSWGKIHYAKDGVHIVPTKPRK